MSRLISTKSSALYLTPSNQILHLIIQSFSSLQVTVILILVVCFSPFTLTSAIAVGDRSHCSVYASCVLSAPCRISPFKSFIPPSCPYRLIFNSCTLILYHLWSSVSSVIFWSSCLAVFNTSSWCYGSSILLVLAGAIRPLMFPFSL